MQVSEHFTTWDFGQETNVMDRGLAMRGSRQAHYLSLDKMGRRRARRVAWSGGPSGDEVIDVAAYECLRSNIGPPIFTAILCALSGFFFLFVHHRYVAGFGMFFSMCTPVGWAIYVGYRARSFKRAMADKDAGDTPRQR